MTQLQFRVRGIGKVTKGLIQLPNSLDKHTSESVDRLMKNIQKDARMRAPKWTGALAESITISRPKRGKFAKQWFLKVGKSYGGFWEFGFTPHFVKPSRTTRTRGGPRVVDWMADKGLSITGGGLFVGKNRNKQPFIKPAFENNIGGFGNKLSSAIDKAIKESFR